MREPGSRQGIFNHAVGLWIQPLRRLVPGSFDHYRPEKHYMRGPGPKWLEKHGAGPRWLAPSAEHGGRADRVSPR